MLRRTANVIIPMAAALALMSALLGCSSPPGSSSGCKFDQDCATGEYCDQVYRACKTGCRSAEKCSQCGYVCSAQHVCQLASGACCSDSDCAANGSCSVCVIGADAGGVGTCQTGCLDDSCCSDTTQYCQTSSRTCQAIPCSCYDSNATKCRGTTTCKAHASGTTSACIAGGCCTDGDCDAGSLYCDRDGTGTCKPRPCTELGCSSGMDIECKKFWTQTTTYYCSRYPSSADCDGGSGCCCAGGCSRSDPTSCSDPCTLCDGNHACSAYVFASGQNPNNLTYNTNDSAETADNLPVGSYKRFLCPSSLQDWFAVNVGTDETWTVRVSFDTGVYPTGDPGLILYGNGATFGTINLDAGVSREKGAGIAEELVFMGTADSNKITGDVIQVAQLVSNGDGGQMQQGAGTYYLKVSLPNGSTGKLEYTITISKLDWPACSADGGTDDSYDSPANDTCVSHRASDPACQAKTMTMTAWDGGGELATRAECTDPHYTCTQFKAAQNPADGGMKLCDADYFKPSVSLNTSDAGVASSCYQFADQFRARVLYDIDRDAGGCGLPAGTRKGDIGLEVWMAGPDAGQEVLYGNAYLWAGDAGAAQKRVGDDGDGGWVFRQTAGPGAPVVAVYGLAGQCNDAYRLEMEALNLKRCASTRTNTAVQYAEYQDTALKYVSGQTMSKKLTGGEARCPAYDQWWKMQPATSSSQYDPTASDGLTNVTVKLKMPPSPFDAGGDQNFNWASPLKLSVAPYTYDGGLVSAGTALDAPAPSPCDCGDAGFADAGYSSGCRCTEITYPGGQSTIPANQLIYFKVSGFNPCAWSDYTLEYKATTTATCPTDSYETAAGGGCVNNNTPGCAPNILTTFPGASFATWPTLSSPSLCTNDVDYYKLPSGIQLNDTLTVSIPPVSIGVTAFLVNAADAGDPALLDPGDAGGGSVTNIGATCTLSNNKCNRTVTMPGAGNWYLRFANTGSYVSPYQVTTSLSRGATGCDGGLDLYDTNPDNSNFVAVQADGGRNFYASTSLGHPTKGPTYFTASDYPTNNCPAGAKCKAYYAVDPLRLMCSGTDNTDWYKLSLPEAKALVRVELCAYNLASYNPPHVTEYEYSLGLYRSNGQGGTTPTCASDGGSLPAGCGNYFCSDLATYDSNHEYCDCVGGANISFNRCESYNIQNLGQVAAVSMGWADSAENYGLPLPGVVAAGDYFVKVATPITSTQMFRSYRLAVIEWKYKPSADVARAGTIPCTDQAPWR